MFAAVTRSLAAKKARLENDEKGFTLIELLVVVIIIGILAAIAIPIFLGQQEQAKGSAVESAIGNAKTAIVAEMVKTEAFPTNMTAITDAAKGNDPAITLTVTGGMSAFCIKGVHSQVASPASWAADDTSGVIKGSCNATFKAVAP